MSEALTWRAKALRLTLFGAIAHEDLSGALLSVIGMSPEVEERHAEYRLLRQRSPWAEAAGGTLELSTNGSLGRVDWLLNAGPNSQAEDLGPLDERVEQFKSAMASWICQHPATHTRIAIGLAAAVWTESDFQSYEILSRLLPNLQLDPASSRDLLYQINRPSQSDTRPGLKLNHITRWMAVVSDATSTQRMLFKHFAFVDCDHSTPVEPHEFRGTEAVNIVSELFSKALESVRSGDRPLGVQV